MNLVTLDTSCAFSLYVRANRRRNLINILLIDLMNKIISTFGKLIYLAVDIIYECHAYAKYNMELFQSIFL